MKLFRHLKLFLVTLDFYCSSNNICSNVPNTDGYFATPELTVNSVTVILGSFNQCVCGLEPMCYILLHLFRLNMYLTLFNFYINKDPFCYTVVTNVRRTYFCKFKIGLNKRPKIVSFLIAISVDLTLSTFAFHFFSFYTIKT